MPPVEKVTLRPDTTIAARPAEPEPIVLSSGFEPSYPAISASPPPPLTEVERISPISALLIELDRLLLEAHVAFERAIQFINRMGK